MISVLFTTVTLSAYNLSRPIFGEGSCSFFGWLRTNRQREYGFAGAMPVGCFDRNGFDLFDMAGNVWELTEDDYADLRGRQLGMAVTKGDSYLCADNYCFRYRPSARQQARLDSGASHIGFRTAFRQSGCEAGVVAFEGIVGGMS